MKATINGIIVEGTPEEIITYQQLNVKKPVTFNVNTTINKNDLEWDTMVKQIEKALEFNKNKPNTFWM